MKKIIVRKILKYDPTFNGIYSKYEGYRLVGMQKIDPGILESNKLKSKASFKEIFCSSLKRGRETAGTFYKNRVINLDLIREVKFDLRNMLSEEEYLKFGSDLVRKRFIQKFIDDDLSEKRRSIHKRIDMLLEKIGKLPNGRYLLISHSFFMKILQTFLIEADLFDNPELIKKHFDPGKKTFEFGKGFEFNVK